MKVRVPVAGTIGKTVVINTSPGSTIGVDLRLPNGQVATVANLKALLAPDPDDPEGSAVVHSTLDGLQNGDDHPQYTMWQDAERITGQWTFATMPIIEGFPDRFLDEFIEDVIGGALQDSESITLHYDDYGQTDGRISATLNNEYVLDLIGFSLVDTPSIDLQYDGDEYRFLAEVIPGGVDHDQLMNYVADQHVPHSEVEIVAGFGLSGGGDITASRTIDLDANLGDLLDVELDTFPQEGDILTYDGSSGMWINAPQNNVLSLDHLTDVELDTFPSHENLLVYDAYSGFWVNASIETIDFPNTSLTVGAAGPGAALPATPEGYAIFMIGGVPRKVAFYAV